MIQFSWLPDHDMRRSGWVHALCVVALMAIGSAPVCAQSSTNAAPPAVTYDGLISEGNGLLKDGKLKDAYQDAMTAAKQDPQRFEAFALAAFVLERQGEFAKASEILEEAVKRAPEQKRAALGQFKQQLAADAQAPIALVAQNAAPAPGPASVPPRKVEALKLILEDADKATADNDRRKFLEEFMDKSEALLKEFPGATNVWMLRARVAVDLGNAKAGWEAGQQLKALGADKSTDDQMVLTLAKLDRKGWLADKLEAVKEEAPPENPKLFPAQANGKWGFIDETGKVMIPLKFDHADVFSEGLAAAKLNGKYGYIDATGEFVIEPKYDGAFRFSGGLARVAWGIETEDIAQSFFSPTSMFVEDCIGTRVPVLPQIKGWITGGSEGGDWGFIDRRGKEVFNRRFTHCVDFVEGEASVTVAGKVGIIGKDGTFILEPTYAAIHPFSEGLAEFSMQTGTEQIDGKASPVFKEGFLDKQGKVVIEAKYDTEQAFSEGLACVLVGGFEKGSYGFIDRTGAFVIPATFKSADSFSEGLAWVSVRGNFSKAGNWFGDGKPREETEATAFIDKTGKCVIGPDTKFDTITTRPFSSGLAAVQIAVPHTDKEGRLSLGWSNWAFIDRQGKVVIPAIFDYVPMGFRNGLALVRAGGGGDEGNEMKREGCVEGYINLHGRPVWGVTEEHFTRELNRVKDFFENRPDKKYEAEWMKKMISK